MNMTTPTSVSPQLPPLVEKSASYKLVVPSSVEKKIRYLIRKFPSTEWSGILFYSHEGSFEENSLVITCVDFFPMDLGSSAWTEFQMSEDVTAYMADNPELFICDMGLIHSHHSMGAFFSGQDNIMLQQEGNDTNCFVSLVVDTKGTYVARITRKLHTKSEVTVKSLDTSYEFFGEGVKSIPNDSQPSVRTVEKTVIEYFDLAVERHEAPNDLDYLDSRFAEIETRKKRNSSSSRQGTHSSALHRNSPVFSDNNSFSCLSDDCPPAGVAVTLSSSKPAILSSSPSRGSLNLFDKKYEWTPDPKKIHKAVVNILTCSLIVNPDKIDLKNWTSKYMLKVYEKMFGSCDNPACQSAFIEWKDFIITYILDYFDIDACLSSDSGMALVAEAIINEISALGVSNPYIDSYCDSLYSYLE